MRRNLPGTFQASDMGGGAWRLSRSKPTPIDVFVRGADSAAAETFGSAMLRDIEIEWHADAVALTVRSAEPPQIIGTQNVIVHEPLPRLSEALPPVIMDAKTRRFWRRVFRLLRIPGGRYLLGVLARRNRGSP